MIENLSNPRIHLGAHELPLRVDIRPLLGDKLQPVMAHLIESRKLTLADVREAEKALLDLQEQEELAQRDEEKSQ